MAVPNVQSQVGTTPARTPRIARPYPKAVPYVLIAPALAYFLLWVFFPIGYEIWVSLTNNNMISIPAFVGLKNFSQVLTDPQLWHAAYVTLLYAILSIVPTLIVALGIAILLNDVRAGRLVYQTAFFLPVVIPAVASALVWALILQPAGLLNDVFSLNVPWLTQPDPALVAISLVTVWSAGGYYIVVFLASLQNIPGEVVEAAALDGANKLQTTLFVILPLLRPALLFATVTCSAAVITNFTLPYVMTSGGPGDATTTLPLLIYKEAFEYSNAGAASAISFMLLIVTIAITFVQFRVIGGTELG